MSLFKRQDKHKGEKIEVVLTKSGIIARLAFLVITLTVASIAFYNIFAKVLHTESGWKQVNVDSKCVVGNEFVFHYNFGVSGMSSSVEWSTLNKLYSTVLNEGYKMFGCDEVAGMGNLYQLNSHPNEEVYIEKALYEAIEKLNASGSRFIFYAPVYSQYRSLFSCEDEYAAANFDPFVNDEVAAYVKGVCGYAKDENHIRIELYKDNKAKLVVSKEYLDFSKENEIDRFVDLYFARNAFLTDYVADRLIESGYTAGVITSVEGYARALGTGDYSMKRFIYNEGNAPKEELYTYTGPQSIVSLRSFPLFGEKSEYYYVNEAGDIRHIFINPDTGLCVDSFKQLLAASDELGCSDMLIWAYDCIVNEEELNDSVLPGCVIKH